jgi:hypothetical protein
MSIPNRMQKHWPAMIEFLKKEWPLLTEADFDDIDGEYDRLILKIKEIYGGGSEIQMEGKIKSKIQSHLNDLEGL